MKREPILWAMAGCIILICAARQVLSQEIILTEKGTSSWTVSPLSEDEQVLFASAELSRYLQQISGASLPVNPARPALSGKSVLIGLKNDIPAHLSAKLPEPKPGYNGYRIVVSADPEQILIIGDDGPGVIYGVYALLEKLGCRWFYPQQDPADREVIPSRERIVLTEDAWGEASPIRYRIANGTAWFFNFDFSNALKQLDWAMKNRYNGMGWQAAASNSLRSLTMQYRDMEDAGLMDALRKRGMFLHGPGHGFDQLLPTDDYFADHPEWFGMREGKRVPQQFTGAQFCWSNPGARRQFVRNAVDFVREAKEMLIFSVSPFDGGMACTCPECTKAVSSNLLLQLMSELIDTLATVRPEVLVETLGGYNPVKEPPTDKEAIHPHLRIIWAQWGRFHGVGYSDPAYDSSNLDAWREAARGGLTVCQYYPDNFAEPWVMGPFTVAMESDRDYFLKNRIDAVYMLMWAPGYWWNHGLNAYLGGRVFYDTQLDPFVEIEDYATHYFGAEAGPLLAAYYQGWARNIGLSYRIRSGHATDQDRAQLALERRQFIDPAVKAAENKPLLAHRVGKVAKLHSLAEKIAETHAYKQRIRELRKNGSFGQAAALLEEARRKVHDTMYLFYVLGGLNQGLMDSNEVPSFIKMTVQDWLEEEETLIGSKSRNIPGEAPPPSETNMLPAEVTQ